MPDINNADLQSGSLGDEPKVATGLIFGASDAEERDSGDSDSHLGPIPVLVHMVRRKLGGNATSPLRRDESSADDEERGEGSGGWGG